MTGTLPRLEDCLEFYVAAVDRYGTEPFTPAQAERELAIDGSPRLLELAVAYGLLEYNDSTYAVRAEPDAPASAWRSNAIDRAERIRAATIDRVSGNARGEKGVRAVTHSSRRFASVGVDEDPTLERVLERLKAISLEEYDGIVLRASGECANAVQRLADRLCQPSVADETVLSGSFQKEHTDVVGDDKNELEFRLFLERT